MGPVIAAYTMHDIRLIRENPEAFDAKDLPGRGLSPMAAELLALDETRRVRSITQVQDGTDRSRNEASKAIGAAKAAKDEATRPMR